MAISKEWKWEVLSNDDEYWNTPHFMIHYLNYRWKKLGFTSMMDVGCGMGRHSLYMAKNGFDVSAFDYSKYVIDIVKEKAYDQGLNIKLETGNITSIPFDDNSIDCALAIGILSNNDRDNVVKALKEIKRVLKDNGEVYFDIVSKVSDLDMDNELFNGNNFYPITEQDFETLFKGFEIIDIKQINDLNKNSLDNSSYCILLKKSNKRKSYEENNLKDSAFLI